MRKQLPNLNGFKMFSKVSFPPCHKIKLMFLQCDILPTSYENDVSWLQLPQSM